MEPGVGFTVGSWLHRRGRGSPKDLAEFTPEDSLSDDGHTSMVMRGFDTLQMTVAWRYRRPSQFGP